MDVGTCVRKMSDPHTNAHTRVQSVFARIARGDGVSGRVLFRWCGRDALGSLTMRVYLMIILHTFACFSGGEGVIWKLYRGCCIASTDTAHMFDHKVHSDLGGRRAEMPCLRSEEQLQSELVFVTIISRVYKQILFHIDMSNIKVPFL